MKLIRNIIFIFVILLILAKIGWLQPDIANKVEGVGDKIYEKVSTIEYKGKQVANMSVGELATNVKDDVKGITDQVEIKGTKVIIKNDRLNMIVNPESETVVYAIFDRNDEEAASTVNNVIKSFTGIAYDLAGLSNGGKDIEVSLNRKPDGSFDAVIK